MGIARYYLGYHFANVLHGNVQMRVEPNAWYLVLLGFGSDTSCHSLNESVLDPS